MVPIAADEAQHAQLAWEVLAWALPRIDRSTRRRIQARQAHEIDEVSRAIGPAPEVCAITGHPDAAEKERLLHHLRVRLWEPARRGRRAA